MKKSFVSTNRRGFHMTFSNGLTVSVQWGAGNYCDNFLDTDFSFSKDAESNTAEVVVFNSLKGEFIDPQRFFNYEVNGNGKIVGYLDSSQVVELLANVRDWPNI